MLEEPDRERAERDPDTGPRAAALEAAEALRRWLVRTDLRGVDPYDALRSPLLARLAVGRRPRQAAIQVVRRLPMNVRPLLGIRPYLNAKGLGLVAAGAAKLEQGTGSDAWRMLAERAAEGAVALRLETPAGPAWGYPFDVQMRWGYYTNRSPNAIATVFTARALLVAGKRLGRPDLAAAADVASFLDSLASTGEESFYAYVPGSGAPIHNANLLVAALRARLALDRGDAVPAGVAEAVRYSLRRQRPDGSWPYGEAPGCAWVDGFHTAYVLSALADLHELTGEEEVREAIVRGAGYYAENLFETDGTPRYYATKAAPLDSHNAATAISTLLRLGAFEPRAPELAKRVAEVALRRLQTPEGWFLYQRGRLHTKRVPYMRWSNAHMLNALADLILAMG